MKSYTVKTNDMTQVTLGSKKVKLASLKKGDHVTVKGELEMGTSWRQAWPWECDHFAPESTGTAPRSNRAAGSRPSRGREPPSKLGAFIRRPP